MDFSPFIYRLYRDVLEIHAVCLPIGIFGGRHYFARLAGGFYFVFPDSFAAGPRDGFEFARFIVYIFPDYLVPVERIARVLFCPERLSVEE